MHVARSYSQEAGSVGRRKTNQLEQFKNEEYCVIQLNGMFNECFYLCKLVDKSFLVVPQVRVM